MSAGFVEVAGLTVRYGPLLAADDVGFRLARGEHLTLLGPSGCGKTTTLRAIAGLEAPSAGRIVIDGATVCDVAAGRNLPPERRGLSMVFQSYAIWPHMTVFENVAFSFRARGIGRGEACPAVERALALVGLDGFADRPATRLSGGQQQRVALARAIACDSKVVLFDEPLSNLDAQLRLQMRTELAELRRRLGFTAIYVTHDQEEAFSLSDRIIVMRNGRIEQEGTPRELHHRPRTRFVAGFFGMRNILAAEITPSSPQSDLYAARLAPDIVLRASDPGGNAGANGSAVGFRPSDVEIAADDKPAADGIPGTVERMVFLGDAAQYHIRSGPIEICAQDRPRDELAEGRKVRWRVAAANCVVLSE